MIHFTVMGEVTVDDVVWHVVILSIGKHEDGSGEIEERRRMMHFCCEAFLAGNHFHERLFNVTAHAHSSGDRESLEVVWT